MSLSQAIANTRITITDSTISGNNLLGIQNRNANASIVGTTISGNQYGVQDVGTGPTFSFDITGSIVATNSVDDCLIHTSNQAAADKGYNLDSDRTCGFSPANHSQSGVNPNLGPLQNNGGPTDTQAPVLTSPAVDQIPNPTTVNGNTLCPGTDQRGVSRPQGTKCDIGAVEVTQIAPTQLTTSLTGGSQSGSSITVPTGTPVTDSATLSGTNSSMAGGTLTYTVYSDNTCKTSVANGGTVTVSGGSVPNSNAVTLTNSGTYTGKRRTRATLPTSHR
jgi:hypothetical protein